MSEIDIFPSMFKNCIAIFDISEYDIYRKSLNTCSYNISKMDISRSKINVGSG